MEKSVFLNFGLLLLRAALGVIFLSHGLQKLFGAFGGGGIEGVAAMMEGMGFAPAYFWAWVLALTEGICGFLLFLGVLPRTSAFLLAVVAAVAIARVHGPKGFFLAQGGYEYLMLILAVCAAVVIMGAGKFAAYNRF